MRGVIQNILFSTPPTEYPAYTNTICQIFKGIQLFEPTVYEILDGFTRFNPNREHFVIFKCILLKKILKDSVGKHFTNDNIVTIYKHALTLNKYIFDQRILRTLEKVFGIKKVSIK